MWHKIAMVRLWLQGGLAGGLLAALLVLPGGAFANPRLEHERCTFKPPRGGRVECFTLIGPETRQQPESLEVGLKKALLKATRTASADPMVLIYARARAP